jgi:uncharacterized membrane protein YraQ (UPF0718 family)
MTDSAIARPNRFPLIAGVLSSLTVASALVAYKASAALAAYAKARASGTLAAKKPLFQASELAAPLRPLADTASYLSWVIIALTFGVVLGAAVKALVPRSLLARTVAADGIRGQLAAAFVGAPLMLCSCCAAPVFEGVYEKSRRLGPALALMFASPALNPAALALTFLLFPQRLAVIRLVGSLALVLVVTVALERIAPNEAKPTECTIDAAEQTASSVMRDFGAALRAMALRTLPAIVLGVVASAALAGLVPLSSLAHVGGTGVVTMLLVAALAIPVALPTFGEIPIGLALLAAGAPESVVMALLIAGPSINLPSLLTVGRSATPRAAVATGLAVFAVSCACGLAAMIA